MRIAVIHLSDFHIHENDSFVKDKIYKISKAISVLNDIDEYTIVFSGDLANSGAINEYKHSRFIFNNIINGLKENSKGKFIKLIMVPGNHDLCLPKGSRTQKLIQLYYDNNSIDDHVSEELDFLNNYYKFSHANHSIPYDKIINRYFCTYGDYKVQYNLVNTALFSTLQPDDKELHYFPQDKLRFIKRSDDADLCITVMHHTCEWFNWKYKADLEREIINNSDILCTGHDHYRENKSISIGNSSDTWVSCAGEMKFSDNSFVSSFNAMVIDTDNNTLDGYVFEWNSRGNIYTHKIIQEKKTLNRYRSQILPLPSFLKSIKEDNYNNLDNFLDYFVFPKLVSQSEKEFKKYSEIKKFPELLYIIEKRKSIIIKGASNSGKSTLLKYLYYSYCGSKIPLFIQVDSTTRINNKNFIKRLFEDQYGDDPVLLEKYQQTSLDKKVIIIDGWDQLNHNQNKDNLMKIIKDNASIIILSIYPYQKDIVQSVKDELLEKESFFELRIKPFYTEKRNELVRNICTIRSSYNDDDILRINRIIDSLVQNNNNLFSLNPAFIIQYTDYFLKDRSYDYAKGEAVFSKVFEYEINKSIVEFTKNDDFNEFITVFEEIAGYMYLNRKDVLRIEDVREIISNYHTEYGVCVDIERFIEVGIRSKLFKKTNKLEIYFSNKNYLSYFIAKYLIRLVQSDVPDYSCIEYALKNICFGINSDIILFILYLSDNTKMVMSIAEAAGELLSPWEELNFEKNNVKFLSRLHELDIKAPTEKEQRSIMETKEKLEELQYNDSDEVDAIGLFEYDENSIDHYHNRLVRAIKYTEMICKALPAFNSTLKIPYKNQLIKSIYTYPHKIAYAMLSPVDSCFDQLCKDILKVINEYDIKKKNGHNYLIGDIMEMFEDYANGMILSIYDHFSELCTSKKTYDRLINLGEINANQKLQRLMIIENAGKTDELIKTAEAMIKESKDIRFKYLIRLVIRKHLICKTEIQFNKRQQIIDKFFPQDSKKDLLLTSKNIK